MKYLTRFATGSMMLGTVAFLGLASPAYASLSTTGVCPNVSSVSPQGSGGAGNATDCNLLITFGSSGSITTDTGLQTTYDSIDDSLIGVVNNSGGALSAFNISGSYIFGFDGDGIDLYVAALNDGTSPEVSGNPDTTGYGGPLGYFTNIASNNSSGTVNFDPLANGATTYFSLEEPISQSALPVITSHVPEPSSLLVFGFGILGLGFLARRRKSTYMES